MELKKSTNNIIHLIENKYYYCNHAVGKHKENIYQSKINLITCKNCLRKKNKKTIY